MNSVAESQARLDAAIRRSKRWQIAAWIMLGTQIALLLWVLFTDQLLTVCW
jgi:hypothetical protein